MASIEEPLLYNPLYADDSPYYEICGVEISFRDVKIPDSITINHVVPKEMAFFYEHFSNLRHNGSNFDLIIKLNEMEWNTHKAVLCVKIPLVLVVTNPNWPQTNIINIPSEFDPIILETIIDYAYNGSLTINESNAQSTMMIANYLLMDWLVDECADFLLKRIRFDDALPLLSFFHSLNYNKLEPLFTFIDMNFVLISNTLQFTDLCINDLVNVISSDSLRIDNEDQVFNGVTRWIGKDTVRMQHGMRLLKCIRLNRITSSFITTIEKTEWIMDNQECLDWVKRKDHSGKSRFNKHAPQVVCSALINGGLGQRRKWSFEIYNPISNSWAMGSIRREKNVATSGGICTTWKEMIVFVGGELGSEYASNAMYNTRTNTWEEIPSMRENRMHFVAEVIEDKLYCAGGKPHEYRLVKSSFEVFNLADPSQGWSVLPNMRKERFRATSCVLDRQLYVFCGLGPREDLWEDGERFDPETNEWNPISPMPTPRYDCTAATLNGLIYIVGAWGDSNALMDVYSPSTDTWKTVRDMNNPRGSPQVFAMFRKLYSFGGENERGEYLNTVESYEPLTETWKDEPPMRGYDGSRYICSLPIPSVYPLPYR